MFGIRVCEQSTAEAVESHALSKSHCSMSNGATIHTRVAALIATRVRLVSSASASNRLL